MHRHRTKMCAPDHAERKNRSRDGSRMRYILVSNRAGYRMDPNELFRYLAERIADVYWTADGQGLLTYIAPQVQQLIGRDAGELVGEPLRSFVHDEDLAEAESLQKAILQRATRCTVAYRLRRAAGNPVWVEATVHAIRSSEGQLIGFAGTWQDISERRRIEEAYEYQGYHDTLTGLPNRRLFH